jgi:hypothetical protein
VFTEETLALFSALAFAALLVTYGIAAPTGELSVREAHERKTAR